MTPKTHRHIRKSADFCHHWMHWRACMCKSYYFVFLGRVEYFLNEGGFSVESSLQGNSSNSFVETNRFVGSTQTCSWTTLGLSKRGNSAVATADSKTLRRALSACLPRQDHVRITTDRFVCFHNNELDGMRCRLDSTENPR